jgi:hypothetical protein
VPRKRKEPGRLSLVGAKQAPPKQPSPVESPFSPGILRHSAPADAEGNGQFGGWSNRYFHPNFAPIVQDPNKPMKREDFARLRQRNKRPARVVPKQSSFDDLTDKLMKEKKLGESKKPVLDPDEKP